METTKIIKQLMKKQLQYGTKEIPLEKVLSDAGFKEGPLYPQGLAWHKKMKITTKCPKCHHKALIPVYDNSEYCELLGDACDWCGFTNVDGLKI